MRKCLSVDWLQLHVSISDLKFHKDYTFVQQGFQTKSFRLIYEIGYRGEEFATLVMSPTSPIIPSDCGLVKFKNRQLYGQNIVYMANGFLKSCCLTVKGITRIDIALDFNRFANSLEPRSFIHKFLKNDYLKIGRGKFCVMGEQKKENEYQYLRFGKKTSEMNVYLYNKSVELEQIQDKPYIRKLWSESGLDLSKHVWRVEISLKGQGSHYIDLETGSPCKIDYEQLDNGDYLNNVYFSYINQLFRFVINDNQANKTRMQDLNLFGSNKATFKPLYLPETTGANRTDKIFLKKLYLLDQEIRGFNSTGLSAQEAVIRDFIEATDLQDYFARKSPEWDKKFPRPE